MHSSTLSPTSFSKLFPPCSCKEQCHQGLDGKSSLKWYQMMIEEVGLEEYTRSLVASPGQEGVRLWFRLRTEWTSSIAIRYHFRLLFPSNPCSFYHEPSLSTLLLTMSHYLPIHTSLTTDNTHPAS